jgi:glutamate-1-semialdehyde 2,1-aminomutase
VTQVGARVEFQFAPAPPCNGSQAGAMLDADLERIVHLFLLNRGVLITPFHNMMLICPQTTTADVRRLLAAFDDCLAEIAA